MLYFVLEDVYLIGAFRELLLEALTCKSFRFQGLFKSIIIFLRYLKFGCENFDLSPLHILLMLSLFYKFF